MGWNITLLGDPISTQHIYKYACRGSFPTMYMTQEGKDIKETYQWVAKSQWKGPPLEGDVEMSLTFYFRTKRRRDLDNQNKLILDALSGIVYHDDSQIAGLHLKRAYDNARPRIEITIQLV